MDIVEQRNMLDGLLRGMLKQRLQKSDKNFADDVKKIVVLFFKFIIMNNYLYSNYILDCKSFIWTRTI